MTRRYLWLYLLSLVAGMGCQPPAQDLTDAPSAEADKNDSAPSERPRFCAAIRGNGNWIFSHFGALSRVIEEYGAIDAMAGGSSASITIFLYESMLQNPLVPQEPRARAETLAIMVKAVFGYAMELGNSEEAAALMGLYQVAEKVQTERLKALFTVNWLDAGKKLKTILESPENRGLINAEAIKMLANLDRFNFKDYKFKVAELIEAASVIGAFSATDRNIFFREPIIDFDGLAVLVARVAHFLSGVDPTSNQLLGDFLEKCRSASHGLTWNQLAEVQASSTATCGQLLGQAVTTFRKRLKEGAFRIPADQDRLQQPVGGRMTAFIPSGVLQGKSALDAYQRSLERYRQGLEPDFQVDFNDVKFGYYVPDGYRTTIVPQLQRIFPDDAKAGKAVVLNPDGPVSWRTALGSSTVEPGLSRIMPRSEVLGTIGGWADLHPVQILRAAGCERILYISRIGAETQFITKQRSLAGVPASERHGVAELLNMTAAQQRDLYLMSNPGNSFNTALRSADAVWCTDWDTARAEQLQYMFDHSYGLVPAQAGDHAGHLAGISLVSPDASSFFTGDAREVKDPLEGCKPR